MFSLSLASLFQHFIVSFSTVGGKQLQLAYSYCYIVFYFMNRPHLFIHPMVDTHLNCFQFSAIRKSAVLNTRLCMCVALPPHCFPKCLYNFTFPPTVYKNFIALFLGGEGAGGLMFGVLIFILAILVVESFLLCVLLMTI